MLDPKDSHLPARLPELPSSPNAERAIGAFIIAWGRLERELDGAFAILFRLDPTLAICIYAGLGTKAKLDILASAIAMLREGIGEEPAATAHDLINAMRQLSGNARNVIAHGQPLVLEDSAGPFDIVRHSAALPEMVVYSGTAAAWRTKTAEVTRITKRWRRAIAAVNRALLKLSPEEFRWHCAMSQRDLRPKRQGRRSRLRQGQPGS